ASTRATAVQSDPHGWRWSCGSSLHHAPKRRLDHPARPQSEGSHSAGTSAVFPALAIVFRPLTAGRETAPGPEQKSLISRSNERYEDCTPLSIKQCPTCDSRVEPT